LYRAREKGDLAIQRPRRPEAERTRRPSDAVDDLPARNRHRGRKGATQLEQDE